MKSKVFKKKKSLGAKMPFEHVLDLTPIINQWKEKLKSGSKGEKMHAQEVLDMVKANPELSEFISDFEITKTTTTSP